MKNISKIISIVFLNFSILLLCYVFYRSQVVHFGAKFDYYLKYYIIAFLFIILSFISFFIPEKLKINITIVFTSTIICLYIVEGYFVTNYLIKTLKDNRFEIYKNNTGQNYDKRSKFQIYNDLKKENPNIAVTIVPSFFLSDKNLNYLPLSGLSNRKTISCNENGYYSIYQSDRFGFNTPDEEWDKDEIEFFLVGDSLTHGDCVNEPDTISGNLRKLINNENGVLNLGQGANGPLIEYATLREYLPHVKVKRVLWLFHGNDLLFSNELKNQILVTYLKDKDFTQNLFLKKQFTQELLLQKLKEKSFIRGSERFHRRKPLIEFLILTNVRTFLIERFFSSSASAPNELKLYLMKEFENIIKLSNELAKENNSKFYFIYFPYYERYKDHVYAHDLSTYKKAIEKAIEIVENLNVPIINLNKELFEKQKDPLSFFPFRLPNSPHFNESGYELIANIIFNKIEEFEK